MENHKYDWNLWVENNKLHKYPPIGTISVMSGLHYESLALSSPLFIVSLLLLGAQVKVKQPPDEGCGWRRDLGGDSTALNFDLELAQKLA